MLLVEGIAIKELISWMLSGIFTRNLSKMPLGQVVRIHYTSLFFRLFNDLGAGLTRTLSTAHGIWSQTGAAHSQFLCVISQLRYFYTEPLCLKASVPGGERAGSYNQTLSRAYLVFGPARSPVALLARPRLAAQRGDTGE